MKTSRKDNYILGIGGFAHDSSAALLKNGELIAAIQEERLTRCKHIGGFPFKSVEFCLKHAGIGHNDIDRIAFYIKKSHFVQLAFDATKEYFINYRDLLSFPSFLRGRFNNIYQTWKLYRSLNRAYQLFPKDKFYFVDHHDAHAAGSFLISPFSESLILCIDAGGDGHCTSLYYGEKNNLKRLIDIKYPDSISHVYTLMTYYLGFLGRGNQYKLMGLSAYGKPVYYDKLKPLVLFTEDGYRLNPRYFRMKAGLKFSNYFYKIFGPARQKDENINEHCANMAATMQKLFEDVVFHLCHLAKKRIFSENLCISGGSALNCVVNGKLISEGIFKNVFVPPGASDCGSAIGAAFYYHNIVCGKSRDFLLTHDYWGNEIGNDEVKRELKRLNMRFYWSEDPAGVAVSALSKDKIVGWFQGRMEYGPRALGNRSILADPRSIKNKDRINKTIKFREEFRPFAPAILTDFIDEYFEKPNSPSPFMTHTFQIKQEKRNSIPSVVHVDGSGRLQSVTKTENPHFYTLIKKFYELANIPVVLNTSFNLAGDPIVCHIDDAVKTFERGDIDVLIIGNYVLSKDNNR